MIGFIVKYKDHIFKAGSSSEIISLISNIKTDIFSLSVASVYSVYLSSSDMPREGIEFEIEIADIDKVTPLVTKDNDFGYFMDPEYEASTESYSEPDYEDKWKLQQFRKIETILKEEGLI